MPEIAKLHCFPVLLTLGFRSSTRPTTRIIPIQNLIQNLCKIALIV
jgi:hypothetical protein